MAIPSPLRIRESKAKNWTWATYGLAVTLNLLAEFVHLGGPFWFGLRTVVLVAFTGALLTYLTLRFRRGRESERKREPTGV
ncbi:hypothetical protein GCM10018785_09100 [Streptomyces longispororuber]|uniref:Uncharacterized protein n=1 Tax=Streptomyces longispororuber TaxID=68230 RepID=A0A918Z934_9ACTN|nr:hypothetical protein [Streptomyces longispororuber]GHE41622.1 hypothetical protein GCM10018785_09100 [Streptomyces longispororuber]